MKIGLIALGEEVLGLEYLSSVLKKSGHTVKLFFDPQPFGGGIFLKIGFLDKMFDIQNKLVDGVTQWKPDIVGFSCMTNNYQWCLKTAKMLKSKSKYFGWDFPIVFGGIHPTILPNEVLSNDCVDFVAIGESEHSFLELLDNLKEGNDLGNVNGIYSRNDENFQYGIVKDLDSIPFPDHSIFYDKIDGFRRKSYTIIASRGCPYSCSYCCNDTLKKFSNFTRRVRSVDNIINELKLAKSNHNISKVMFIDEIFPFQIEWIREFCKRYKKEIGLPFEIINHFYFATEDRIKLLSDAGCYMMEFGLQSASKRVREGICNRYTSNDMVKRAIGLCKKYRVQTMVEIILGLPSETDDEYEEAIDFYRDVKPDIIYSYWLTYFPKTNIINKGIQYGNLTSFDIKIINSGDDSYYHKGSFIKNRSKLLEYQVLIDLVALLPKGLHKWVCSKTIRKFLPRGYFIHFILLFISDLKLRKSLLWDKIQPMFSIKHVP